MLLRSAAAASLALAFGSAHADWHVRATGEVHTNVADNVSKSDTVMGKLPAAQIDLFTEDTFSFAGVDRYANARLKVKTEMGRIHAYGDAYATNNEYPGFDGGVADFHSISTEPGHEVGDWYDVATVTSTTLAYGTPVQLMANLLLEGTKSAYAPLGFNDTHAYARATLGSDSALVVMTDGVPAAAKQIVVNTFVGDTLIMYGSLEIQGYTGTTTGGPSTAKVDAWNTSVLTLESLTPGASFTTDSGWNYQAQPVPEPAPFAALGLGALAFLRRRTRA